MNVKLLENKVLVKPIETKNTTSGGLAISSSLYKEQQIGEVISTGEGKTSKDGKVKPIQVKKGDKVLYYKQKAYRISIEMTEYDVIYEDDVLVILT